LGGSNGAILREFTTLTAINNTGTRTIAAINLLLGTEEGRIPHVNRRSEELVVLEQTAGVRLRGVSVVLG
jgi:hypothetical protein